MFCENCGTKMEGNESFCSNCGEKIQVQTGLAVKQDEVKTVATIPGNKEKQFVRKKAYLPAISIIVVIALLATSIIFMNPFSKTSDQIIYLKGSNMMLTDGKMKNPKIITSSFYTDEIIDNTYSNLKVEGASQLLNKSYTKSKDGKFVFYIDNFNDNKYSIFRSPVNDMEEKTLITDNAMEIVSTWDSSFFKLTDNDNGIIYREYGYDNVYFYSDFETDKQIISNGSIVAMDDMGKIIYQEYDESGAGFKLNFIDIKTNLDNPQLIDKGFIELLPIVDHSKPLDIYYVTKDSPDSDNVSAVKLFKDGLSKELFGRCEYTLNNIYDGGVYLTVAKNQSIDFSSIIDDNMIQLDKNMKEPTKDEYTTTVPETDFWFGTSFGNKIDWDAYNDAYREYQEKIIRDNVRTYIKNNKYTYKLYDVYYVKDGKSTLVTDKYSSEVFSNSNCVIFNEMDYSEVGKLKMSDLSKELGYYYDNQLESKFNSMISVKSNEKLLYKGKIYDLSKQPKESTFMNIMDCGNGNKLLAVRGDFYSGKFNLIEFDINNENCKVNEKIIDTDLTMSKMSNDGKTSYYYKTNNNEEFYNQELVMYKDDVIKTISDNVTMGSCIFAESGEIYFISGYQNNNLGGDFMKYSNGKLTKIATNVIQYYINSENELYYLADVDSSGSGTLFKKTMLDLESEAKEIDTGVTALRGMGPTYNDGFEVFDVHKINLETETF